MANNTSVVTMNGKTDLASILENICALNIDNGKEFENTDKLDAIKRLLKGTPYKRINKDGLFHMYARKDLSELPKRVVVISSHADTEKGIKKPSTRENGDFLEGTYDNMITNGVVLKLMLDGKLPEDVLIAFTGDEERNATGAKHVCKFLKKNGKIPCIVVTDVTGDGYSDEYEATCDFSIENDFWGEDPIGEKIVKAADGMGMKWCFVSSSEDEVPEFMEKNYSEHIVRDENDPDLYKEAWADESWEYDEREVCVFSLCIPIDDLDNEHTDTPVKVHRKSAEHYAMALEEIARVMDAHCKL